jgi:CRP/FNR family cyclic AMP-dependent transcriptional regulator
VATSLLRNVYLFRDMNSEQLDLIQHASQIVTLNAGDEVFSQGEKASAIYIINFGSVKIYQTTSSGESANISTLGTGSHFGEMSFLDDEPRSATVEALEKTNMTRIDYEALRKILNDHPAMSILFFRALAIFLCSRLRKTTTDLNFSREMNLKHF